MAIKTNIYGDVDITCVEYGDRVVIRTSVVASRIHLIVESDTGGRGTATLNLAEMRELRDHLSKLLGES